MLNYINTLYCLLFLMPIVNLLIQALIEECNVKKLIRIILEILDTAACE